MLRITSQYSHQSTHHYLFRQNRSKCIHSVTDSCSQFFLSYALFLFHKTTLIEN